MNRHSVSQEQIAREKALNLYISAFERGDFEVMDPILQKATLDPILNRMIMEVHDYFLVEDKMVLQSDERARVRALVFDYLAASVHDTDEEVAIPSLTVEDVIVSLQHYPGVNEQTKQEARRIHSQLPQKDYPLPQKLSIKEVYRMFEQLGVSASTRLQKVFREKAIFLSMGHEQGMAQLAATRHQRHLHQQKSEQHDQKDKDEERLS
jgi:hypothetical protein